MEQDTELIARGSVADKVKAYNAAISRIELAYRTDLVQQFNAIAAGANLKPSN